MGQEREREGERGGTWKGVSKEETMRSEAMRDRPCARAHTHACTHAHTRARTHTSDAHREGIKRARARRIWEEEPQQRYCSIVAIAGALLQQQCTSAAAIA